MIKITVCIGSSCHLKGSAEVVELFQKTIAEHHLEDDVVLSGSFCIGKCNLTGVSVQIDEQVHVGVNRDNFRDLFKTYVLDVIENERK